ncbi:xanthine dehydrogenase/oxidase-like [Amphiura filiformis]|uniref:xanthine dehydrogenase/oxidase-like n=1 Tax=Amphiura filiformis TaxID=82378 RepID=UPI003B2256A7
MPSTGIGTSTEPFVFFCNGRKVVDEDVDPELTLLTYIRTKLRLTGSKLGCAEGGCGACTVMVSSYDADTKTIRHFSVNACLAPICSVHGMAVTTVEGIRSTRTKLHPVQERIAKAHGSQCGFCTPGIVMSMYTLLRNNPVPNMDDIFSAFEGNLCRCTGYRPILEGYKTFTKGGGCCGGRGGQNGCCMMNGSNGDNREQATNGASDELTNRTNGGNSDGVSTALFQADDFTPYDSSQEPIFPPELMTSSLTATKSVSFVGKRLTWHRPVTLPELLNLKAQHPSAKIVVGNTEIGVEVKFKNQLYPILVCTTHIPDLQEISVTDSGIHVGASVNLTTLDEFLKKHIKQIQQSHKTRVFSAIVEMLKWFAGHQIRNVAAVGGNIVTGSPISDLNPLFMAAGCTLELESQKNGRRSVKMDQSFYTGYRRTIMQADEVLVSIHIPYTSQNEYFYGYKQSPRREDDIAIVNAGIRVRFEPGSKVITDLSMAFGGMAATTVMATKTSESMIGREWNDELVSEVSTSLAKELPLLPGAPGGMETYRQSLTLSFFFKFYLKVLEDLDVKVSPVDRSAFTSVDHKNFHSAQFYQEVPSGQPSYDSVGRPDAHKTALQQATGEAVYCDDIPRIEGELYLALVTSTKAHANIIAVDTEAALAIEGVHTYVSAADVPGDNMIGVIIHDEELFATKQVHCVGQIIGGIVAENQAIAQRAAKLVKIQYEELEPIITIEDAIEKQSFLKDPLIVKKGDVEEAFKASDHIIEGEVRIGGQEHFYLETQCSLAIPKGESNEMEIFMSSQSLSHTQHVIADCLGVPYNRVVCRSKRLGGGFGGKESRNFNFNAACAIAANKVNRPVRTMLDRDEDMVMSGTRHPYLGRYKVGFTKEGIVKGLVVDLYANCGISWDLSPAVMERAVLSSDNAYLLPAVIVTGYTCKTNLPSNTAFRGFGAPQGMLVAETWMSQIAVKCGISQEQVRSLNLIREGQLTHFNQTLNNCTVRRCWEECLEKSCYASRRQQVDSWNKANRWKKRGLAAVPTKFGIAFVQKFMNQAGALIHIYTDGSVLVSHSGVEMGQGLHTKMIQVASRYLKVPAKKIFISETSTNLVPNTQPTAASSGSDLNGNAVKDACEKLMHRLEPFMLANPKGTWEDWVTAAYLDRVSLSATGFYKTPNIGYDWEKNEGMPFNYFTFGAAVSEVEIDCLTGDHEVIRTDIVMDVGDSINPAIDIGQIEGGFTQGYGLFTLEDHRWNPKGHLLTRGPGFYKIPGFGDVPKEFNVSLLRGVPNNRTICSSKAIGEPPLFLAASVFFAIKDAITSARADAGVSEEFRLDSPATSDRIRMACVDQFTKQFKEPVPGTYTPFFVRP